MTNLTRAVLCSIAAMALAVPACAQKKPMTKVQKVYRAPNSDFIAEFREVIRDSASFANLWALSGGSAESAAKTRKAPKIDFKRKMVIAAAGPARTAPDSIVIRPEKARGVYTVLTYRNCKPGAPKTMPIDIIAIGIDPGSVMFTEKTIKGPDCS